MWWPSVSDAVSADNTIGVFLLAVLIAAIFYGVTILQSVQYVDRFYNDSWALKFFVLVLWLFETMTMILEAHALYTYSIVNEGIRFAAVSVPWSVSIERAFSYAVVYAVQLFFTMRLRELGRRYWLLPAMTGLLSTATIALGLAAIVTASQYNIHSPSRPGFIDVLSTTSAGLQIGTDVLIAISLYWLCRNRTGNMKTRDLIKHFVLSAVNRGVFSALLQILTTATYFGLRPRLTWIIFHMASSKVHVLSVLSTLNVRSAVDGIGHDPEIIDARLRYRIERELGTDGNGEDDSRADSPPVIPVPSLGQGLQSNQSSWFVNKSEEGGLVSYVPSYHARSTTAVDG